MFTAYIVKYKQKLWRVNMCFDAIRSLSKEEEKHEIFMKHFQNLILQTGATLEPQKW